MKRAPSIVLGLLLVAALVTSPSRADDLQDLYFGEALFYAHQGLYFEALERLDTEVKQHGRIDEPELDTLYRHIDDADFSLGDFELRYRMHHRAGRAIEAVLDAAVDDVIRNDAAYRLARIHFQKDQLSEALAALDRIEGEIPETLLDDIEFLRANVLLAEEQPADAIPLLEALQASAEFGGFASYNLGIAYLQAGRKSEALEQLSRAGQLISDDPGELAIRDKSNLVAGTVHLEASEFEAAIPYLNRVRLDGPYSNQALLSAGWANVAIENIERAVVPWSILADREVTDRAAQEAMLALPYAYGKLNVHGRAAVYYGRALDAFSVEIEKLNSSVDSIREGKFLEALIREEIRKDKDWVIQLRALPEAPETYYLMDLLASHDFQTGLQNYLDLAELRRKLVAWERGFDSYDEMVEIRHDHYEPLLPEIDTEFRELDSKLRLRIAQHEMLVKRRDSLLTTPRPEFLATPEERVIIERLAELESQVGDDVFALQRIKRLQGVLVFRLQTEYHARFTEFDANLRNLDKAMAVVHAQHEQYVRVRQATTHSFAGYEKPIERLRVNSAQAIKQIDVLMSRQGRVLEKVAVEELTARRSRLENFGDKARFALADSYDRATETQARSEAQ
ncbi:MAG: tetratricopeptide repeat protein [Woeseiaceae bacterium]